jgi:hypothetical protein
MAGAVGQHEHPRRGDLEPVVDPQLMSRMGDHQGGAARRVRGEGGGDEELA